MDVVAMAVLVLVPVIAPFRWLPGVCVGGTSGADADDRKVAEARPVAKPLANLRPHRIELGRIETGHPSTALTRQKLLVAGADQHVEARAVPEMDVLDNAKLLEPLEVPIDRGQLQADCPPAEPIRDELRRDRAVGSEKRLEDEPTGR